MLLETLVKIKDFRRGQGRRYDLGTLLFLSILAISCNADSYRKIEIFIREKYPQLKKEYGLKWKGVPSYSTIRNAIQGVSSSALEEAFREDANARFNNRSKNGDIFEFSFDGKVIKGSFDHFLDQKAIQILSVYCRNYSLIMAHVEIEEKTNEIPVAQILIPSLALENVVFTCDAINCQVKTINAILESGNDFIVQVKNNQKILLKNCIKTAENLISVDEYTEDPEKAHGRITSRKTSVYEPKFLTTPNEKWDKILSVIQVERDRKIYDTKTKKYNDKSEISYYIATNRLSAESFNSAIRGHWGIENRNHYVKDVAMNEDSSRIRVNPQNMVKLRSFSLNILRDSGVENIESELYKNSLTLKNLFGMKT